MKIAIGMFYPEANSFNPNELRKEELVYCEGQEVLDRMYATEVFQAAGAELVPLIYAVALPGGIMSRACYDFYADRILEILSGNQDVDAVFLHLHGACEVSGLGSGEYDLLKRIRALLGERVYIGVAFDFHGSNEPEMPGLINAMRNYRTVPHSDQPETEKAVARHLLDCISRGDHTITQYARVPFTAGGEKALGADWPLCHLFMKLEELEREPEIAIASMALGMAWCDSHALAASVVITPARSEHAEYARRKAKELAADIYSLRDEFDFDQLPLYPHEAVRYALRFEYGAPVFVSDSGDNTTGGAVGDHTVMLREFLKVRDYHGKRVLVTAIWDEAAVDAAWGLDEGDEIMGVRMTAGENQLIVATRNGMAIRIEEKDMRPMSRSAHGVKAIKLRNGDYVVSMARIREGASVLTVTDRGLGRRCPLDSYRIQKRGGYGMKNYSCKNGDFVCGIKVVDEEDDIIMTIPPVHHCFERRRRRCG